MPTAVQQRIECHWFDPNVPEHRIRWRDVIQGMHHDVYHLPDYVRIDATVADAAPLGFYATDGLNQLFIPLSIRRVDIQLDNGDKVYDASSPYGYSSPCTRLEKNDSEDQSRAFIKEALVELAAGLRHRNVVAAFVRSHPLLADCFHGFSDSAIVVRHGDSIVCDLRQTDAEMWQQTRRRDRTYINRSRREGYRLVRDVNWSRLDDFVQIYKETMRRVAASDFYFFPKSYFESIRDSLANNAAMVFVISPDNTVACGGIFTHCNGIVQYHLGGTSNRYHQKQPAKLLIDGVRRWARDAGHRFLHLGGGVGASTDSLFHFKAGFSKLRAPFSSCRFVTNQSVYSQLLQRWEQAENRKADRLDGFFPAYRKPSPTLRVVDTDGLSRRAELPGNPNRTDGKVSGQSRRAA